MSSTDSEGGLEFHYDDADITLRSSDHVDYHAHKIILSTIQHHPLSSSRRFRYRSQTQASRRSTTLSSICQRIARSSIVCWHSSTQLSLRPLNSILWSLDEIMDAFAAAKKYDMAASSQRLEEQFVKSKFIKLDPMLDPIVAFCAAYSRELGDPARSAAKASLKSPMNLQDRRKVATYRQSCFLSVIQVPPCLFRHRH